MLVKKGRLYKKKKKGEGLMDSLISAIFSETSKKLATSAAEAAIKTAANKGAEKIINSIGNNNKKVVTPRTERATNKGRNRQVENIFSGTSIKFIR